jgi:hypothetical protein
VFSIVDSLEINYGWNDKRPDVFGALVYSKIIVKLLDQITTGITPTPILDGGLVSLFVEVNSVGLIVRMMDKLYHLIFRESR